MPYKDKQKAKEARHRSYVKNKEKNKEYYHNYYLTHKEQKSERERQRLQRYKEQVIEHYGGKCACCGESNIKFLTVDHINGGGRKHRVKVFNKIYHWLIKHNFPPDYQILCWNCNCGKAINHGVCPHLDTSLLPLTSNANGPVLRALAPQSLGEAMNSPFFLLTHLPMPK